MIDILYLAKNRRAFTEASLSAMEASTDWARVRNLWLYDDGSTDGTLDVLRGFGRGTVVETKLNSPVAVMNDFLKRRDPAPIFAKIDNDTMLPPGWLGDCLGLMEQHPALDLLGIEAMFAVAACGPRSIEPASYIGGIGLMRTRCFTTLPVPDGRYGFTDWPDKRPEVQKAWITPSLPVFLLDRMPMEPWASLNREYKKQRWQRPWSTYGIEKTVLWDWWLA